MADRAGRPARPGADWARNHGRYVLARRWSGLGDCLVSLLAAHRYAKATGRALVVDWRHSSYAPPERNLFALVFEPPGVWDGVPVLADDRVADFAHAGPCWPPVWNMIGLDAAPDQGERGDARAAAALVESGVDVAEPVVVFDGCIAPQAPPADVARRRLLALRVRETFAASVADFRAARFAGRPVVGVHVRHGNGGVIGDHARWWINPGAAMLAISDTIRAAVDELCGRCEGPAVVFVATDSAEIEATLRQLVPGMITRAKAFRPAGAGELHRWAGSAGGLHDAMVEMLLLAEVDVLLRYPPGSYYSYWGATMGHGTTLAPPAPVPGSVPRPGWH